MRHHAFAILTTVVVVCAGLAGPVAAQGASAPSAQTMGVQKITSTKPPMITGTAQFGSVLTGDSGTWSPTSVALTRKWLVDGAEISGATGPTYVPVAADVGKKVTFRVTAAKPGFGALTLTSASTAAVAPKSFITAPVPTMSGEVIVGSTLQAVPGTWSPSGAVLAFEWSSDGRRVGTAATYTLTPSDVGSHVTVKVTSSLPGYATASRVSLPTATVAPATLSTHPVPTISGGGAVDSVLTASAGDWQPDPVTLTYQWFRDGNVIDGATSSTYSVGASDGGTELSVKVQGSKPGYVSVTETSGGIPIPDPAALKTARALSTFRTALANADTTPVDIFVGPGDSFTEGYGASSLSKRFVSVLARQLRAGYQPAGVAGGIGYVDPLNAESFTDYPVSSVNGAGAFTWGLGRQALALFDSSQTIRVSETFTDLDIRYAGWQGAGWGAFSYTVDGGTPVMVSTGGKPSSHGGYVEHISGLAPGHHDVVITGVQSLTASVIEGVTIYNGDRNRGIRVWEGGANGATATAYAPPNTTWAESLESVHPDLIVLPIGFNDYYQGETAADTKSHIEQIIATMRANIDTNPSIVLVAYPDHTTSTGTDTWSSYLSMYQSIAAADPEIAFFDLGKLFDTQQALAGPSLVSADGVHPSDAGHELIGEGLASFISP